MHIEHICFDLDGTLVKSDKTIYKSTLKALEQLGINSSIDEKRFNEMLGMHFVDIFNDLEIEVPDFDKFIDIYKSYYFDFIDESILYPNIEETLSFFRDEMSVKISLLTTKGQDQAEKIITHFCLNEYFNFIMGRRDGIAHKPSAEPLLIICNKLNVNIVNTVLVGDTEIDIGCGKNAGAVTCAVSYGYRSRDKLLNYKPDFIFNSPIELKQLSKFTKF